MDFLTEQFEFGPADAEPRDLIAEHDERVMEEFHREDEAFFEMMLTAELMLQQRQALAANLWSPSVN